MISKRLIGHPLSPAEVSNANRELIAIESIRYLFMDEDTFDMKVDGHMDPIVVLVAIGVTEIGHKPVLEFQAGDKESPRTGGSS